MRYFLIWAAAITVATSAQLPGGATADELWHQLKPTVLSQDQVQQLELTIARNSGDLALEALLGRNYAFFILGITSLKDYDFLATIDPGKAAGSFAQHARDELGTSRFAGVVAEGGQALWRFSTEVEVHQRLRASQPKIDTKAAKTLGVQSLDRAISMDPSNATWRTYRIPILISRSNFNIVMPLTTTEAYVQVREDMSVLTGSTRYYMLAYAAKLAVKVSELNDAQNYAQEMLKSSTDLGNDYGNAIFFANLVLGQAALRQGSVDTAPSGRWIVETETVGGSG